MTPVARDGLALQRPGDIAGFPEHVIARSHALYRVHQFGVWYFASDKQGRFDLSAPAGTCYLAADPDTALREALGPALLKVGFAEETFLAKRRLSRLHINRRNVADACAAEASNFGITLEISTCPYPLAQEWAAAWFAQGFGGIRYNSRCSSALTAVCFALFGDEGPGDPAVWATDPNQTEVITLAKSIGIEVTKPSLMGLTVTKPPGVT